MSFSLKSVSAPMPVFLQRSQRPFFFPRKKPRFIRFSGQIFAFDYNFIGRFFYVLLEIGLKHQVAYKVPNFLKQNNGLFSRDALPYGKEDHFLFIPSYSFVPALSAKIAGLFPITFFNSIFLGVGFNKHSFRQHFLLLKESFLQSTLQRVLVDVDSHLSLFFSRKHFFFPKNSNYISSFKYIMDKVYLISGDHNVSSFTASAEGPFLHFSRLSFRKYRDFFLRSFFKELRFFFFERFFFFPGVPEVSRSQLQVVDFIFGYFYISYLKLFDYISYLKLLSVSFFFPWISLLVFFKVILVEFASLFFSLGVFRFPVFSLPARFFFRKFLFFMVRLFLVSGAYRNFFSGRAPKIPLFTDLVFPLGLGLRLKSMFSFSNYREGIFQVDLPFVGTALKKKKSLRCWEDSFGFTARKKKRRWFIYMVGYYSKMRRKKKLREGLGRRPFLFPRSLFRHPPLRTLGLDVDPQNMVSSFNITQRQRSPLPGSSLPGVFGPATLNPFVINLFNDVAAAYYVWKKDKLALQKAKVLSLAAKFYPLLFKKTVSPLRSRVLFSLRHSFSGGTVNRKLVFFRHRYGRYFRSSHPQVLGSLPPRFGYFKGKAFLCNWQMRCLARKIFGVKAPFILRKNVNNFKRKRPLAVFVTREFLSYLSSFFRVGPLRSRFLNFTSSSFKGLCVRRFFFLQLLTILLNKNFFLRSKVLLRKPFNLLQRALTSRRFFRRKKNNFGYLFAPFKRYSTCCFLNVSLFSFIFCAKTLCLVNFLLHKSFKSILHYFRIFFVSLVVEGLSIKFLFLFFSALGELSFSVQRLTSFLLDLFSTVNFDNKGLAGQRFRLPRKKEASPLKRDIARIGR